MAESYRGLTIRIGADTSKLSAALREANGAITAASNQARRLKQALAMDPQNASAMAKQFSVVGEQAGSVTAKLVQLRKAYSDVTAQTSKSAENGGKTFGELAQETDNAALAAENLKSRYGVLEGDLNNVYKRLSAISHNLGTGKNFRVTDGDSTDLKRIAAEYDVLIAKRKELWRTKDRTDEQNKELEQLNKRIPVYEQLMLKARELKATFNEVSVAYDDARTVAQLKDLETEMAKADSQAMQLFSTLSSKKSSSIGDGLSDTNEKLKQLGIAADEAGAKAKSLGERTKIPVSGLVAAFQQGKALGDQFSATYKKATLLSQAISRYKSAGIDKLARQTKDAAKEAEEAKRAYDESAKHVSELEQQIGAAVQRQKELADHSKQGTTEYKELGQEVERLQGELSEAKVQSEGLERSFDQSKAVLEYKNLNAQLDQTKSKLAEIMGGGSFGQVTSSALLLAEQVGQYARQGMTQVIDSTMTLDESFADMRKTVNGTEEEFQNLYDSAVKASKVQPISADTILSIEALGGQLGFAEEGLDKLSGFADVVSGLDVATNMDWQTAGTYMAQFFNVFQTHKDLVSNYGSALVDLGNHFATTESDISMMSARIASAGTSIGMSEADVLGLATALSSMGVKAEAGGSAISTIMTNIDKSVALGTKGIEDYANQLSMSIPQFIDYLSSLDDDAFQDVAASFGKSAKEFKEITLDATSSLEEWSKAAGYKTAEEFASAWSKDPIDALTKVFLGLDEAAESGGNLALMLDNLGVSSIRQLDISRRLASNPQLMADAIERANRAWEENTALTTEVEKRNESLSARYETLKNIITAIKTEFGEGLSPIIDFAIDKMQLLADKLDGMSDESKTKILTVTGALAGLVVVEPIVKGVGGAVASLAVDLLKLGGGALTGVKTLVSTFSMVGGIADVIPALSLFAETGLATVLPVVAGIAAGIAGIVTVYTKLKKASQEAEIEQENFNAALKATRDSAYNLRKGLKDSESAVDSFAGTTGKRAMSLKELTDDLNEFNESISGMREPVEDSNALLTEYKKVIDDFGGKGTASAEELAKLEWAVQGINETFGTNYSAIDILNDKYQDEEGEIDNLCAHIDKLIEKRQQQARIDAAQDIYTESLKKQYEYERNYNRAAIEYQNAMAEAHEVYKSAHGGLDTTDAEILERNTLGVQKYKEELDAAAEALATVKGEVREAENLLTETTEAATSNADALASFVDNAFQGWDIDWSDALERNGASLDDFAQRAEDAGITLDDLKAVADDPDVFFSQWVDECEGDIDALIAKIQEYNDKEIEEKEIKVKVPDQKLALDESKLDFSSKLPETQTVSVKVDTASSMKSISGLTDAINGVPPKVQTTAYAYTDSADRKLITTKQLADALPSFKTIWVSFSVDTSSLSAAEQRYEQFRARTGGNAAGGIRYHADGMILNRPTWIGPHDIAGEAGAEAIIPLTNKRYVQPFADTVADGMLSKLNELQPGGTTYNITVNAAGDTGDDIARAITRELRAYQLMTNGR